MNSPWKTADQRPALAKMFVWLKMLFCIWIKVLAAELALGGISNNESWEYYSLLENEKAKLIEYVCQISF